MVYICEESFSRKSLVNKRIIYTKIFFGLNPINSDSDKRKWFIYKHNQEFSETLAIKGLGNSFTKHFLPIYESAQLVSIDNTDTTVHLFFTDIGVHLPILTTAQPVVAPVAKKSVVYDINKIVLTVILLIKMIGMMIQVMIPHWLVTSHLAVVLFSQTPITLWCYRYYTPIFLIMAVKNTEW